MAVGRSLFYPHQEPIGDLKEATATARYLALAAPFKNFGRIRELPRLERVWIWKPRAAELELLCEVTWLRELMIRQPLVSDLAPIARLSRLERLELWVNTRVRSLEPLASLARLREPALTNFARISTLEPLGRLRGLETLCLSNSVWSRWRPASLAPLRRLDRLRELWLDLRVSDGKGLEPIAGLRGLRRLVVPNAIYPIEQYALLAARLVRTRCSAFSAVEPIRGHALECETCGGPRVLLTGKGAGFACRHCGRAKIARHRAEFARLRLSFSR